MKLELIILGVTAFFIANAYHDDKYIKLVKDVDTISVESYDYLNDALISGKDTQDNIILKID